MYNLICFPHYTCGGLLADILNNTWSEIASNGGINSVGHSVGKIGDNDTIFTNFTQQKFDSIISTAKSADLINGTWLGTHCWPGDISTDKFDTIINVTTCTNRSKLYRWIRTYHHFYLPNNIHLTDNLERIDKFREGAKQYLIPFNSVIGTNIINIEFCEIVEGTMEFVNLIKKYNKESLIKTHIDRWRQLNSFLYNADLWNSYPVKRFYEAEYETLLNTDYIYS